MASWTFWTVVAMLRIFQAVGALVLEDSGGTGIYPLPFCSLRLSGWSLLWQEMSLTSPPSQFSYHPQSEYKNAYLSAEKQGKGNTRVNLSIRIICVIVSFKCVYIPGNCKLSYGKKKQSLNCFLVSFCTAISIADMNSGF